MSTKEEKVVNFCAKLTDWKINHIVHNPYHVQVQIVHNFYPSKGTYYNSETAYKCNYPKFKDANDFLEWLSKHTYSDNKALLHHFTVEDILEVLDEVETLEEAKKRFLRLTE